MTNQQAVTFDAIVTPSEITVCDSVNEKVAYHENCGEESVLPFYEQHKPFFRSLAKLCRAMTEDTVVVKITPDNG